MKNKIVWDTEFTSWEGCHENGWNNNENQYKELIQIGAVKLNEQNQIIDWFNSYVQPIINPELSTYITELTGVQQTDVDESDKLPVVWEEFLEWQNDCPAFSWENDIDIVQRNKQIYKNVANDEIDANYSLPTDEIKSISIDPDLYFDIKPVLRYNEIPVDQYNSGTVCEHFSSEYNIDQHDALEDARSLALSLQEIN